MLLVENIGEIRNVADNLSDEEFLAFCVANPNLRIERDKNRNVIIMPPLNSDSGFYESTMIIDLGIWNRKTQLGITFSSSSGFKLPDGSIKSPDASWVSKEKWQSLTLRQRKSFAPIAPEFIVEVRSKTDSLVALQTKMEEWIANGVLLAWLIDPTQQKAYIYRADGSTTQIDDFNQTLSGENVLPEFTFDLNALQMP